MTLEIIGSVRSTYARVARMACEEKGIEYALKETTLGSDELRSIHPFGKMPVMRHGDFELCESKAIATYIDRCFPGPRLIPDDARLAGLTEQWVSLVNTEIDRTLIRTYVLAYIRPKTADGSPNRTAIDETMPAVREQCALLNKSVAKTGFLAGDRFTFADINLLPILFYLRRFPEGASVLAANSELDAYYTRHAKRPSFVKTIPPLDGPPGRAPSSSVRA